MEAKPQLDQSAQEAQIRAAIDIHWRASASGDTNTEHDIYALLTPEQRKQLEEHRHERGPRDHDGPPAG